MCGRFVRETGAEAARELFDVQDVQEELPPSYNVAPRQPVAVIMEDGVRKLVAMQWGLIPRWAKDEKIGSKLINARAETITEKPSFRDAFRSRRCLIIADGFYEWRTAQGRKQPVFIYLKDKKPFGMAGIYELWTAPDGRSVTTCAIITTAANAFMQPIHHRMPVIIAGNDYQAWLDPEFRDEGELQRMLASAPVEMESHDVARKVNSVAWNHPDCILPRQGQGPEVF
jgi:putative SOS response-associated peptidase YedK